LAGGEFGASKGGAFANLYKWVPRLLRGWVVGWGGLAYLCDAYLCDAPVADRGTLLDCASQPNAMLHQLNPRAYSAMFRKVDEDEIVSFSVSGWEG